MSDEELNALGGLSFNWALGREDVWTPSPYHVADLHPEAARMISRGIAEATNAMSNPLGVVLVGQRGAGKTHLLGWAREQVRQSGGYFFLVGDLSSKTFWDETRSAILEQLVRGDGDRSQLDTLLDDLGRRTGLPEPVRDAITGRVPPTRDALNAFATALNQMNRSILQPGQDVARALALLASPKQEHKEVGEGFLGEYDLDPEERHAWGIRSSRVDVSAMIGWLSRILALSGPAVVAVDQIDALIDKVTKSAARGGAAQDYLVAEVAADLMALRDLTRRTLTVIACLGGSWDYVRRSALDTVADRFLPPTQLQNIPTPEAGRQLIEKRFAPAFERAGFTPPYPTWPIKAAALEDATVYTARMLLQRVEAHISSCVRNRSVRELERLGEEEDQPPGPARPRADPEILVRLDAKFREQRAGADVESALNAAKEDAAMPDLLAAGLDAWIRERRDGGRNFFKDSRRADKALHACLLAVSEDELERQQRWAFRAIGAQHHLAVQSRLRKAMAAAGLDGDSGERRLFLLRNTKWPNGPRTQEILEEFRTRGGADVIVTSEDLATFAALGHLLADNPPGLDAWLAERRPAHHTELFERVLGDVPDTGGIAETKPVPADPGTKDDDTADVPAIRVGTTFIGQVPACLELASLRRHMAVFAGSGSGKTVLLRRVIEECALHGVSAIVLDPNNDMARLGDPWPEAPETWADGDAERARRYLEETEVVVWTPRRQRGRPLAFRPLPEFADVLDDLDEFNAAVDAAVEALAPQLNAHRDTPKAKQEKAVLRGALEYFGRRGNSGLGEFTALLAALPADASNLARAPEMAAELAQRLEAARVNDPLFGGAGEPADPGNLLTPSPGRKARVSVISMIGLSEDQRPGFVNQLQMALFSWVKKHPAGDRPLGGLFVMDEAQTLASSGRASASTESTLKLVSQARKYGLGLLFATQSPRGLHNNIPGNATTQFYGLMNSPNQIDVVRDLARAKGGDVPDIGRLSRGEFYLAAEGRAPQKIRTPMCLSYHPPSPLTEEEVLGRTGEKWR
ncbi:MAG: helicase HerA domain-containing protein [Trebonia sp.]